MKKLSARVDRKKEIYDTYQKLLANVEDITLFKNNNEHTAPWFIDCLAKDRDGLLEFLKEQGIGSRVMYPPLNLQKAYSMEGEHPVSNLIGKMGLWLPSAVQLRNEEINRICFAIKKFYKQR